MEWEKGPSPFLSFFLPCSFHFDEKVSRTEGRNGFLQKKGPLPWLPSGEKYYFGAAAHDLFSKGTAS